MKRTPRVLCLLALASMGASELPSDTEFDKITQFLSALDADFEEDSHRKLYSMAYTPVPTPICSPDNDAVVNAAYGASGITSCAVAAAGGFCSAYLCSTCLGRQSTAMHRHRCRGGAPRQCAVIVATLGSRIAARAQSAKPLH